MVARAYVLLSGGIDSTTCLYAAKASGLETIGVSVFYGQRHAKELEYARSSCKALGLHHHTIDLMGIIPRTMLTDERQVVPKISYREISGVSPTYVPFRNGLLLSAMASYVAGELSEVEDQGDKVPEWAIYFGAHAEDAHGWAYPDCTPEFIGSMANAIHVGTYYRIRLLTPLEWLTKSAIIRYGESLGVDWKLTWSCYVGDEYHCGTCPTCQARRLGFLNAGVEDPTAYAEDLKQPA